MADNYNRLREMIVTVARALGPDLLQEVAFVGGCTTGLLLTDAFSKEAVRYTDDVDLIINVVGYAGWAAFQERLRACGFKETINEEVNCRMRLGELRVDFMPDDERVLGFSNRWYEAGLASAQPHKLTEDLTIRLLTPLFFVATKLEAYLGRGNSDPQSSHDMEDILALFDGRERSSGRSQSQTTTCRPSLPIRSACFWPITTSTMRCNPPREGTGIGRCPSMSGWKRSEILRRRVKRGGIWHSRRN